MNRNKVTVLGCCRINFQEDWNRRNRVTGLKWWTTEQQDYCMRLLVLKDRFSIIRTVGNHWFDDTESPVSIVWFISEYSLLNAFHIIPFLCDPWLQSIVGNHSYGLGNDCNRIWNETQMCSAVIPEFCFGTHDGCVKLESSNCGCFGIVCHC